MAIKIKTILCLLAIGFIWHSAFALPIMGSQVAGQISVINSQIGAKSIPLPAGAWKVLYSNLSSGTNSNISKQGSKFDDVYLTPVEGSSPYVLLGIRYNTTNDVTRYVGELCKSGNPYYKNSYGTLMWNQRCLQVYAASPNSVFNGWWSGAQGARSALLKEGSSLPSMFIVCNMSSMTTKAVGLA